MASESLVVPMTRSIDVPRSSLLWRNMPIAVKLPFAIALLVVIACASVATAAYFQVRRLSVNVASERMALAASEIQDLVATSLRTHRQVVQRIASAPAVVDFLQSRAPEHETAARAALKTLIGASTSSSVTLLDPSHHVVFVVGDANATDPVTGIAEPAAGEAVVGAFQKQGASGALYTVVATVRQGDSLLGTVIERRKLSGSAQSMALLNGLVGPDAELLVGNARGDVWTDFLVPVQAPPIDPAHPDALVTYRSTKGPMLLARARAVPGTPWIVAVSLPLEPVLNPASRFLWQATALTALIALGAALIGWLGSRRLSRPLLLVTEAAETVASDRPAPPLALHRHDEIGRLAQSFNTMAVRVEDGRRRLQTLVDDLEIRVQRRTASLEAANRELEAFSYSVSHDLRAPLRAIAGFVTILVEDHARDLPPDAITCVDVIAKRTKHMGQLIDDLLAFSRLGRQQIQRDTIDMTSLTRAVLDEVKRSDATRDVRVVLAELPEAHGERALIRQVFANLLQNSMKFTRTRPDAVIEIGYDPTMRGGAYFVRDNGVGFDMQYADRLFGVFQRLHRAEDFEGTGVGLAIVQRIIERHGGQVWAESALNAGATFFFTVPRAQEAA